MRKRNRVSFSRILNVSSDVFGTVSKIVIKKKKRKKMKKRCERVACVSAKVVVPRVKSKTRTFRLLKFFWSKLK